MAWRNSSLWLNCVLNIYGSASCSFPFGDPLYLPKHAVFLPENYSLLNFTFKLTNVNYVIKKSKYDFRKVIL